ncbi:hypothetical protein GCM10009555_092220 [Acrocarpospora macrocephala]|uniref:Uncharacterized protein n=1 Tax=Acrocarpospora macrocephala TaxID=150177 RepID=A0A5M3WYW5_9ACTN|nr:hypothetical protein [Acrocarpospora macrocephala]GES14685.1 hypothetical protein Amac_082820 [Acrocarpospora macrocephala]
MLTSSAEAVDTDHWNYTYTCSSKQPGSLVGTGDKPLNVEVSIPKTVVLGQALQVGWTLGESPLISPGNYVKGAKLSVSASAKMAGYWDGVGELVSVGTLTTDVDLKTNDPIKLPTLTPGSHVTGREGEIKVKPDNIRIAFSPKSTGEVNDTNLLTADTTTPPLSDPPITYTGNWSYDTGRAAEVTDWVGSKRSFRDDVHHTQDKNATATIEFEGTGIEYIGERHAAMGKLDVEIVEVSNSRVTIDPSRTTSDPAAPKVPANQRHGHEVLWSKTDLPYGKYHAKITSRLADNEWAVLDSFNVITRESTTPPEYFDTVCAPPPTNVTTATVKVVKASTTPTPTTTRTATVTPTPKPTTTVTVTSSASTSQSPQVIVTPKGGAQTGEMAVGGPSGRVYVWFGIVLVLGSVGAGLVWRRRVKADAGRVS